MSKVVSQDILSLEFNAYEEKEAIFENHEKGTIYARSKHVYKRFLFLPFDPIWEISLLVLGLVDLVLLLHGFIKEQNKSNFVVDRSVMVFDRLVDVLFIADNLLLIACRCCHGLYIPYLNITRPIWLIVLDITGSLPLGLIFQDIMKDHLFTIEFIHFLKFLRISYYFHYHSNVIRFKPLKLPIFYIIFNTFTRSLLILYCLQLITWFTSKCNYITMAYDICHSASILTFRGVAGVHSNLYLLTVSMIFVSVGWFGVTLRRISLIITSFICDKAFESSFQHKLQAVVDQMHHLKISHSLRKTVIDLILSDWNKRGEYHQVEVNKVMNSLPDALQSELHTEVYWSALMHSQLFRGLDLPFLRSVARKMKKERMLPGVIIYEKNSVKQQMIYVASGVLQILSEKDGETCIFSFSSGTCLGESTLIIGYQSHVSIRCKNYGEVHVLTMNSLVQLSKKFPKQYQQLKSNISERYRKARELHRIKDVLDENYKVEQKTKEITIMWLTSTLHKLMMKGASESASHECQNVYLREEIEGERFNMRLFTADFLDLLAITARVTLLADSVFVKYECPPILQPNSVIRMIWDFLICFITLISCALIPYYIAVCTNIPSWYWSTIIMITIIYCVDIYIVSTTAVLQRNHTISDIVSIISHNIGCFSFWMDLCAAFPLETLKNVMLHKYTDDLLVLLHINRLLKLVSVTLLIGKFEKYLPSYAIIIRALNNSIPYFYVTYFISCAFFRSEIGALSLTSDNFPQYIKFGFQICSTIGFEQISSVVGGTYLQYFAAVLLVLLMYVVTVGKYAAERILAENTEHTFQNIWLCMNSAAVVFRIENVLKKRMKHYICTQWKYDRGLQFLNSTVIFKKLPFKVYQLLLEDASSKAIKNIPLFDHLPQDVLFELCSSVTFELIPPNEVICYRGSTRDCFYYIVEGSVATLSTITNKREQTINANNTILVAEVCLNVPMTRTHVSLTHCKLLIFSLPQIKTILLKKLGVVDINEKNPELQEIRFKLKEIDLKNTLQVDFNLIEERKHRDSFKKFGYNLAIDSPKEYEYFVPFDRYGVFSLIRMFLLRVTILPSGNFLFCWEICRCVFATLSSVLFVITPVVTCWNCNILYFLYFLDATAWVDIYVRLHVCYYNSDGILVSHPLKTAQHYLSHGFIVDIIAVAPIPFLSSPIYTKKYELYTFLHVLKMIQLYRYLGLLKAIDTPYNSHFKFIAVFKYLPLVLVLCNLGASIVSNIDCNFSEGIENDLFENGVECKKNSFFLTSNYTLPISKLEIHLIAFMFTLRWLTLSGTAISDPRSKEDIVIIIAIITLGFVLHMFLLVTLISKFSAKESTLLYYQKSLTALKRFMISEQVNKTLQSEMINHYELKWKKTKGHNLMKITRQLCNGLQEDVLYCVLGKILDENSVFAHKSRVYFFRLMLIEAEYETFTAKRTICSVNEIVSKLFILCKGTVEVIAPDGTKLTLLTVGSVFGNLDNYWKVRQTVSIKALSNCEVLMMEATKFHSILSKFSHLHRHFKYLTILHIDFLPGAANPSESVSYFRDINKGSLRSCFAKLQKSFLTFWNLLVLLLVFFSTILQIYMQAMREYNMFLVFFLYTCDIVYILNFIVKCKTRVDEQELAQMPLVKISKKRSIQFALLTLDSFPGDVLTWFYGLNADSRYERFFWLRMNRIFRVRYYFEYFQQFDDNIYISNKLLKIMKFVICASTTVHIFACILTLVACTNPPNFVAQKKACAALEVTDHMHIEKLGYYVQSLYIVISCSLLGTQYRYRPASFKLFLYYIIIMLMSIFIFTTTSAFIINLIRADDFSIISYHAECRSMKNFMVSENISKAMIQKIWDYVRCIWKAYKGPVFPEMLTQAPTGLQMKVMNHCFSHYIVNHPIFNKCHEDFIRQLVNTITMNAYFSGDYITFKGDINDCMYFVHRGRVCVLAEDISSDSAILGTLTTGQAFGVLQGLYVNKPHEYYFKSDNRTAILVLKRTTWEYLLEYFPASKEIIYHSASSYASF